MGEYSDLFIDGLVDSETGELIDGDAPGFPRRKSDAQKTCDVCGKRLKSDQGLRDHKRDAHGSK